MFGRALLAFLLLPGLATVVAPPILLILDPWRVTAWPAGGILLAGGFVILLWCARDFYVLGQGTLAPWDPPKELVVIGLYRYVRNPMYIGVLLVVGGWAIVAGSPLIGGYSLLLAVAFHLRILWYEEPHLSRRFGTHWDQYAANVRRWLPRLRGWQ